MTQVLGASGHRPDKLGGYGDETFIRGFELAKHELRLRRPDRVLSGMALGWDTMVAEAAYIMGIPYVAAVPFEGQESRWTGRDRVRYNRLLSGAAEIVLVSPGPFTAWKMQARNVWIVRNCDRILALWNGSTGGTANCLSYAESQDTPYDNLWPTWTAALTLGGHTT